jgi:STE24 endopeptidase
MIFWLSLFFVLLVLRTVVAWWLDQRNIREVRRWRSAVPPQAAGRVDEEQHQRSAVYSLEKLRFGQIESGVEALLLWVWIGAGVLALIHGFFSDALGYGVWGQAAAVVVTMAVLSLPGLPFSWWSTFRIEQKYGFNRSTPGLWIVDLLKGLVLSAVLGIPILAGLFALILALPSTWWIWGALALIAVQLLLMILYPRLILPWFNKLSPLPEGELKDRLMALAERTGFRARTIEVIDGSKRSGHSNAYFTGFGRFRRIVLFDTLMEQLEPEELEAVLAHEIGHYRCGHIPKLLLISTVSTLVLFGVVFWLSRDPGFIATFGFPGTGDLPPLATIVPTFLVIALTGGLVSFWASPLFNRVSRAFEYEADRFAREAMGGARPLVEALWKLHRENLSNLTPDPLYSAFYYSHPVLTERTRALEGKGGEA